MRGYVYVVDDDLSVGKSIERLLSFYDYEVQAHQSGASFFESQPFNSPSVLLLDMRMPELNGIDVQKRLIDQGIDIPVIFISGESLPQEIVGGMKNGAVDFLFKPFKVDELITALDYALAQQEQKIELKNNTKHVQEKYESLTSRQKEVCDYLVQGLNNTSISSKLGITYDAVKLHKRHVLDKMGVDSVVVLTRMFFKN